MLVDLNAKAILKVDVNQDQAFDLFLKTIDMEFVFDERDFIVKKDEDNEYRVYIIEDGKERCFDDRGALFIALRNVAVNMYPNLHFRSDDYIYD